MVGTKQRLRTEDWLGVPSLVPTISIGSMVPMELMGSMGAMESIESTEKVEIELSIVNNPQSEPSTVNNPTDDIAADEIVNSQQEDEDTSLGETVDEDEDEEGYEDLEDEEDEDEDEATDEATDEAADEDWGIVAELPVLVRGMSPKLEILATTAATDGKPRQGPLTDEKLTQVKAMKRWLSPYGYTIRYRTVGGKLTWKAQPKGDRKPMSPEHKAKLIASIHARSEARRIARERAEAEATSA